MDKLSPRYVPRVLQHREDQLRVLSSLYESALDNIEEKYLQVSQLVDPVGTGKTSTAIRFGEMLEEKASKRKIKLKHVYLNGKMEGASRYTLFRSLLADVAPKISTRSLSPEEMLRQLVKYLRDEDRYFPRYSEQQIKDILAVRVGEAFKPEKVEDDLLGFLRERATHLTSIL
jgi:Cdc6-like AAA superfamily ATPase